MTKEWTLLLSLADKFGLGQSTLWSSAEKMVYAQSVMWLSIQVALIILLTALMIGIEYTCLQHYRIGTACEKNGYDTEPVFWTSAVTAAVWLIAVGLIFTAMNTSITGVVAPEIRLLQTTMPLQ